MEEHRSINREIRNYIIHNVEDNPSSIARLVSKKFNVTRQSVNYYLSKLVEEGILLSEGKTRSKKYTIKTIKDSVFTLDITPDLEDGKIWVENIYPLTAGLKNNIVSICQYGFTEILNNAIEHSEGKIISVMFRYKVNKIIMMINDDGVGIFNKIVRDLKLQDPRQAILELSKGKLTTDPEHHTGEGIFFTSRIFDAFSITSGELFFAHREFGDWLVEDKPLIDIGTSVFMQIDPESNKELKEVFAEYAPTDEDYGFNKTHVLATLARYGNENLISRSQARRLLARFENFKEIVLDFEGVDFIGQAFADEIFRVFRNTHSDIKITYVNATKDVEKMIKGVLVSTGNNK